MKLTENKLRKIIKEELHRTPNFNRLGRWDHWQEYTDMYNISYRRFHNENGFEEVYYNEPSNIVLMKPLEGTFSQKKPVAMFGVKRARGIYEDLRHIDSTGYGIKPVVLDEAQWKLFHENTFKAVREVNPNYLMNFGLMDYTAQLDDRMDQDEFNFKKMLSRNLSYNASGS